MHFIYRFGGGEAKKKKIYKKKNMRERIYKWERIRYDRVKSASHNLDPRRQWKPPRRSNPDGTM